MKEQILSYSFDFSGYILEKWEKGVLYSGAYFRGSFCPFFSVWSLEEEIIPIFVSNCLFEVWKEMAISTSICFNIWLVNF